MKISSVPSRARALSVFLVVMLSAAACTDAVSDPMAALMAQETRAALDLGHVLPSLTDVWVESGGVLDERPVVRWEDSWELSTAEGRALRSLVYADAMPDLFSRLREGGLEKLLVEMDSTLARVDQLSAVGIPERVSRRLDSAREMLTTAWILAEEGEGVSSLAAALQASDYLLEVTPSQVAAQLLRSAEGGVRRISSQDSYSEEILGRAERLIDVARGAMQDGDYARAISGSYYACVLLGVELPD
jgi:hypothetical protein